MSLSQARKKILITNDDGIKSEGLEILEKNLEEVCDVYVMAPAMNQSAVSSRISLTCPMTFVKYSERSISCSGSPADCVISAVCSDFFIEDGKKVCFDAVFSGINRGPNLGTDTVYSGTVAAARQAVLYGIPGIAVSLESPEFDYADTGFNFSPLASFCAKNLDNLISLCKNDLFVSINALSADKYNEVSFSSLCRRNYHDSVELKKNGDNSFTGVCRGGKLTVTGSDDCDFDAVRSGKISVSLIQAHPEAEKYSGNIKFNF